MSSLITRLRHSNTPPSGSPPPSSLCSLDTSSSSSSSSSDSDEANKLPFPKTLPDLRFEQSFLASCRGFIHEVDDETARREKKEGIEREMEEKGNVVDENQVAKEEQPPKVLETKSPKGEPELWLGSLRIEWLPLLHLTIRDQLFSPFIQGAVWGVGGLLIANLKSYAAARRAQGKTVVDFGALLGSVGLRRTAASGSGRGR